MIFKHIRPPQVSMENRKGDTVMVHDSTAGITICYRLAENRTDGQWALVGLSFSSPKEKHWSRNKACSIARTRAFDNPLQLQFEGLDTDLREAHIVTAVRTLMIEHPMWELGDESPLRPSRFSHRFGAALLGPSGSLLTVLIDVKIRQSPSLVVFPVPGVGARSRDVDTSIRHWALRIPSWAEAVIREM